MSTSPSRASIASIGTARASTSRASSSAWSRVRFATAAIEAPRERRFREVSSLILPAPIRSTERPSSSPKTCCASAAAAAGTEAGLSPIAVSTRARRPACSAWRKRRSSSGPVAPPSNAARTWPRISPSPGTSESSPAATRNRCNAALSSPSRYSTGASAAPPRPRARAAPARARVERRVVLGSRDRSRSGCTSRGRPPRSRRRAPRERAAPSVSTATRSRSSTGAWWCETPTSASLTTRSGSLGGRRRRARTPRERAPAKRRPRNPASRRSDETAAHRSQMPKATAIARRNRRARSPPDRRRCRPTAAPARRTGARRQAVERVERRHAAAAERRCHGASACPPPTGRAPPSRPRG